MAENTDNTPAAPAAEPAPAPSAPEPAPALASDDAKVAGSGDTAGGYVASSGGASYASDIAMMRAEVSYTDSTVIPHLELLVSQAEMAGNGPKTVQAVRAALDAARTALGTSQDAIRDVQATSEAVQAAYDDAGGEAAKSKAYFHGD